LPACGRRASRLESEVGHGCSVFVNLPVKAPDAAVVAA
jgi:hypothetical protein